MGDAPEPYLELSNNPVRFEAVNQVTNVFFDDSNKQDINKSIDMALNIKSANQSTSDSDTRCSFLTAEDSDKSSECSLFLTPEDSDNESNHCNLFLTAEDLNNKNADCSVFLTAEDFDAKSKSQTRKNIKLLSKYFTADIAMPNKTLVKNFNKNMKKRNNFDMYIEEIVKLKNRRLKNIIDNLILTTPIDINSKQFSKLKRKTLNSTKNFNNLNIPHQNLNIEVEKLSPWISEKNIVGDVISTKLYSNEILYNSTNFKDNKCDVKVNLERNTDLLETKVVENPIQNILPCKVFAVRSGGVMGVVVKGPTENDRPINFRMEDHGPVISIKFSLNKKVLAVQRTTSSVEFMNFNGTSIEAEYSQSCKKNSSVLGFVWAQNNEVALVTDHGIELYLVIAEKRSLKHIKTTSVTVQWFVWCPQNKIALLASAHGSNLQPVMFKPGSVNKLPKVETEPGRMALERDVTLATLYKTPSILIVRHHSGPQTAEVHIHTMNGPSQAPVKTHVLRLGLSGRFAINVVDNLVIVHHQASRCSQIFDISLSGENDGIVTYHMSVGPARSLKPACLALPGLVEPQTHMCELYSPNWVVFQPNIVIDAKLGCLWYIKLCLSELCNQIMDLAVCIELALKRTGAKEVLLSLLLKNIKLEKPPLKKLQESFNHINAIYRNSINEELQMQIASPPDVPLPSKSYSAPTVLIDQNNMFHNVFQKLDTEEELKKLEWVLVAYLTSLSEHGIAAQHNLNELLVTTLVRRNRFSALQQMLQYGVVSDSKPLACLLLALGNMHPSATQLALDMLSRLVATEEIQEILLSQGQLLAALKLAQDNSNPRKFLEAAEESKDPALFHSTLFYFKNNPQFANAFLKDERLAHYVQHYKTLHPQSES